MKNRPKFRIWDKKENKWYEPIFEAYKGRLHDLFITPSGDLIAHTLTGVEHESVFPDRYETVMFTGLKDKNGKEIYEGDIIHIPSDKNMVIGWSDRHASFVIDREGWAFVHYFGEALESDECEVIGNIYENPELLNR